MQGIMRKKKGLLDWESQPATKEKVSGENSIQKTVLNMLEVLSIESILSHARENQHEPSTVTLD